jgi:hypothetical protein
MWSTTLHVMQLWPVPYVSIVGRLPYCSVMLDVNSATPRSWQWCRPPRVPSSSRAPARPFLRLCHAPPLPARRHSIHDSAVRNRKGDSAVIPHGAPRRRASCASSPLWTDRRGPSVGVSLAIRARSPGLSRATSRGPVAGRGGGSEDGAGAAARARASTPPRATSVEGRTAWRRRWQSLALPLAATTVLELAAMTVVATAVVRARHCGADHHAG